MPSEVWSSALRITGVRVDGETVDPWLVGTAISPITSIPHTIEVRIAKLIVLHELHECDVNVSNETLVPFILSDLASVKDKAKAMRTYVDFARGSLPQKKRFGIFAQRAAEPAPRWFWTTITDVSTEDDCLVIKGECYEAH